MEEFDRQIRIKIDSLDEVPGVEFDEKRVWKKIKPRLSLGSFLFVGLLLTFLTTIFLIKPESQTQIIEYNQLQESTSMGLTEPKVVHVDSANEIEEFKIQVLIDSSNIQIAKELPILKIERQGIDSVKYSGSTSNENPKNGYVKTTSTHQKKKIPIKKKETPEFESLSGQTNEKTKELSISLGKNNQTIGITHLWKANNHFHFTYGLQINRSFDLTRETNEKVFTSFNAIQYQVPIGIRYNLSNSERRFRSFLSTDLINSFPASFYNGTIDYNLSFEANLNLDYQVFSTKGGKNGFLRFKLPLYKKDLVNQGMYRPSLYDALKR